MGHLNSSRRPDCARRGILLGQLQHHPLTKPLREGHEYSPGRHSPPVLGPKKPAAWLDSTSVVGNKEGPIISLPSDFRAVQIGEPRRGLLSPRVQLRFELPDFLSACASEPLLSRPHCSVRIGPNGSRITRSETTRNIGPPGNVPETLCFNKRQQLASLGCRITLEYKSAEIVRAWVQLDQCVEPKKD